MKHSFSIIIPAVNESSIINQTIEHVFRVCSGFAHEVIVVDGAADGGTINSIQSEHVVKIISKIGRGKQMNAGAAVAHGNILLFLHSDMELPEDALASISSVMETGKYAGGAFDLCINSGRKIFRLIERMASIRSRLTRVPYGDQAIFLRKSLFEEINGYREIPLMEDVEMMSRVKKSGHKIHIIPQKVKTSARRWKNEGVIYCTLRNWTLISLFHLGVHPDKLVRFYYKNFCDKLEKK